MLINLRSQNKNATAIEVEQAEERSDESDTCKETKNNQMDQQESLEIDNGNREEEVDDPEMHALHGESSSYDMTNVPVSFQIQILTGISVIFTSNYS